MATYERQRYLLMTTDPVHIGTGGYRLGRVDNSIVREPGTKIPKIPGTSLHGAARSYAAQLYETPEAAGQSQEKVETPDKNPVCYTFGYLKKDKKENPGDEDKTIAYSGVVNIFDAQVLLFPVHSMAGPVWVSTAGRLEEAGFGKNPEPADGAALLSWERTDDLNLGWLMVSVGGKATVTAPDKWKDQSRWQAVQNRIVLVQDALFSQVVNSNLEVRTSVAIDPERGAAEDKALFTYEALPRTTFLTAEVVLDDYRSDKNGWPLGEVKETGKKGSDGQSNPLPGGPWKGPLDVTKAGLRMIEWLGVGGMGTRGFGRMAMVGEPLSQKFGEEAWQ
ncbi:MAG: type III-B CRISPR module RAMP protein Cmr4 [Blastocatellia bacterium]